MRIARYLGESGPCLAFVIEETLWTLASSANWTDSGRYRPLVAPGRAGDARALLELGEQGVELLTELEAYVQAEADRWRKLQEPRALGDAQLLPPLGNPGKILCLARNYYEGRDRESIDKSVCTPHVFIKPQSALIGAGDDIRVPPLATVVCPEIEMTLVIGKRGRDIPLAEAMDYVAAYTLLNDFSARKLALAHDRGQARDSFFDWLNGKWFDTFAVMGPWLTFRSAVPDTENLQIRCTASGRLWTQGSTRDMIFSPAEIIAFISQITTLEPGDVIATGVPVHEKGQEPIKSGDVIEGEIAGLGSLRNRVAFLD